MDDRAEGERLRLLLLLLTLGGVPCLEGPTPSCTEPARSGEAPNCDLRSSERLRPLRIPERVSIVPGLQERVPSSSTKF